MVARAKTGSGKTFAYLLPMLQKLFTNSGSKKKPAPSAFVLVPTRELSQQVQLIISSLICNAFPYCFISELNVSSIARFIQRSHLSLNYVDFN